MARYIDADKLVAWCNETLRAQSTVAGKAYVNAFLEEVLGSTTADVAPRAEVAREIFARIVEIMNDTYSSAQYDCYLDGRAMQTDSPRAQWQCGKTEGIKILGDRIFSELKKKYTDMTKEVEVVRCKDCKYYRAYEPPIEDFDGWCSVNENEYDKEFYCQYGKESEEMKE